MKTLFSLIPYLHRYRRAFASGLWWLLLTNALAMTIPWMLKEGIDAAERGDHQAIVRFALVLGGAAVLRGLTRVLSRLRFLQTSRRIEVDLRQDLLERLLMQEGPFFASHRTGDLLSRFTNDLANVRMFAGFGTLTLCNAALSYLFTLVLLLTLSPSLTLIALLPYPIMLLLVKRMSRHLLHHSTRVQEGVGKVSEAVEEGVSGQALIRAFGLFGERCRHFDALNEEYLERNLVLARLRALVLPIMTVIGPLGTLLAIFFGGRWVGAGDLSLGDLVAFNAYLVFLAWPTLLLGWVLTLVQRAAASMERIDHLLGMPAAETGSVAEEPETSRGVAVRLDGLTFGYGDQPVLRDLHLDVPAGSLVGVAGATGSGKTTLLNILSRLYPVSAGQVFVDGDDLAELAPRDLRRRLAPVPQEGRLFTGTLRENLLYGRPEAGDDVMVGVAAAVSLSDEVASFAEGYQTLVGEGGLSLSGGQRQRVCLGRALVRGGGMWLLDDPFSHLDAATARSVWMQMRPLLAGKTVFLVSGKTSLLSLADRVVVLEEGAIVEQGAPDTLLQAGGVFARLVEREKLLEEMEALS